MKQRLITAAWGVPIVMGAVLCTHPLLVGVLLAIVTALASAELLRLRGDSNPPLLAVATGLFGLVAGIGDLLPELTLHAIYAGLFLLGIFGSLRFGQNPWLQQLTTLWVAAPLCSAFLLHEQDSLVWAFSLQIPLLMAFLPIWAGDSAAIFGGKAFGRTPLAPHISPQKTVEGAVTHLIASLASALIVASWCGLDWPAALVCGAISGTLGQVGDLYESHLKRMVGAKDSGDLLPGHGGLLDRVDSMLFALPLIAIYLAAIGFSR